MNIGVDLGAKHVASLSRVKEREKTHAKDAISISGILFIKEDTETTFKIKQFRKKKRSLHEATASKGRKSKNIISKRNEKNKKYLKGFYLNDKVKVYEKAGNITGFTGPSEAYVKTIDGGISSYK